jgi:hypothetical protein
MRWIVGGKAVAALSSNHKVIWAMQGRAARRIRTKRSLMFKSEP